MTDREKCLAVLNDNRDAIAANLDEFFIRTLDDLVSAGVDPVKLAGTLWALVLAHMRLSLGDVSTAGELERVAATLRTMAVNERTVRH
jgi:hypothetical protein